MAKLVENLLKIAGELYSHSMSDRYGATDGKLTPTISQKKPSPTNITEFRKNWETTQEGRRIDKRPKFFTTPGKAYFSGPQANQNLPTSITPKQFNYKNFSVQTPFSKIAPFIASEEAFDGKT